MLLRYFSPNGRMRRRHYWISSLILVVLMCAVIVPLYGVLLAPRSGPPNLILLVTFCVLLFIKFWVFVCVQSQRWHDRGKSGLFMLVALIPYVGLIWILIECGLLDGSQGPNEYGPSPKGIIKKPPIVSD